MTRRTTIYALAVISVLFAVSCSKTEQDPSNKAERNAIKEGNKEYDDHNYSEAIDLYNDALDENPSSRAATYNRSLAVLMSGTKDTALLAQARRDLAEVAKQKADARLSEKAIYNLANDAVYVGDALMAIVDSAQQAAPAVNLGMGMTMPQGNNELDSIRQVAIDSYQQAIANYKYILRKSPSNTKALQNLRITQLKLPPEQQNQNQQNQDQQQQQQQQQQEQPKDQNNQQTLNAVQMKENQSRKKQQIPAGGRNQSDKPW